MNASRSKLWEYLKGKKLLNLPFRDAYRDEQISADFYCDPLKLAIRIEEDDQEPEEQTQNSPEKESKKNDIKVLHFEKKDIEFNINEVIESIKWECALRHLKLDSSI